MSSENEIILYAVIAFAIIIILYRKLGQREGYENPDIGQKATAWYSQEPQDLSQEREEETDIPEEWADPIRSLKQMDSSFTYKGFLTGATNAFEMIIQAYAKGNLEDIKDIVRESVYDEFHHEAKARQEAGEILDLSIVRIENVEVMDIQVQDTVASIIVKFTSEQVHLIRDLNSNKIIEGNPDQIDQTVDRWGFERDMTSNNPIWYLKSVQ